MRTAKLGELVGSRPARNPVYDYTVPKRVAAIERSMGRVPHMNLEARLAHHRAIAFTILCQGVASGGKLADMPEEVALARRVSEPPSQGMRILFPHSHDQFRGTMARDLLELGMAWYQAPPRVSDDCRLTRVANILGLGSTLLGEVGIPALLSGSARMAVQPAYNGLRELSATVAAVHTDHSDEALLQAIPHGVVQKVLDHLVGAPANDGIDVWHLLTEIPITGLQNRVTTRHLSNPVYGPNREIVKEEYFQHSYQPANLPFSEVRAAAAYAAAEMTKADLLLLGMNPDGTAPAREFKSNLAYKENLNPFSYTNYLFQLCQEVLRAALSPSESNVQAYTATQMNHWIEYKDHNENFLTDPIKATEHRFQSGFYTVRLEITEEKKSEWPVYLIFRLFVVTALNLIEQAAEVLRYRMPGDSFVLGEQEQAPKQREANALAKSKALLAMALRLVPNLRSLSDEDKHDLSLCTMLNTFEGYANYRANSDTHIAISNLSNDFHRDRINR